MPTLVYWSQDLIFNCLLVEISCKSLVSIVYNRWRDSTRPGRKQVVYRISDVIILLIKFCSFLAIFQLLEVDQPHTFVQPGHTNVQPGHTYVQPDTGIWKKQNCQKFRNFSSIQNVLRIFNTPNGWKIRASYVKMHNQVGHTFVQIGHTYVQAEYIGWTYVCPTL